MLQNEREGKYEPRKVIVKKWRENLGEQMKEKFQLLVRDEYSAVRIRERLYKKNMGL
jgi:hypothetical protein